MAWYRAGTIKVTANSATVTGTGTSWVQNARVGDGLQGPDGRVYEITNIASNTSLSITPAYQGASATGQTYWIIPVQGYVKQSADRLSVVINEFGGVPNDIVSLSARMVSAETALAGLGTAAKATLSTSTSDLTLGRVVRNGDWGFGVQGGLAIDGSVYESTVNGFYRAGSGKAGAPTNESGAGYVKFGWSGSYFSLIYGSPNSDSFWAANVANGVVKPWQQLWTSRNTTVDSNGFIKKASPIVELTADGLKKTDHLEIKGIRFERLGVGHYVLHDVPLLSRDGWYIETPKDRNNNIYFTLDYEEDEQSKTLTLRTYEPDYSTGRATNGEPMDILEGRFVSLRFAEDPGLYAVYVPDPPEVIEEPAA